MQVRDRLIRETAKELGISIRAVEQVIKLQCVLIRKTMKAKQHKSIYLRKVGMFMPRSVSREIAARKKEFIKKIYNNKQDLEDPLEFD